MIDDKYYASTSPIAKIRNQDRRMGKEKTIVHVKSGTIIYKRSKRAHCCGKCLDHQFGSSIEIWFDK